MKKKIFGAVAVVAIAAMAAFNLNINTENNELSALTLDNVEALAQGEADKTYKYVYPGSPGSGVKCVCSGDGLKNCC